MSHQQNSSLYSPTPRQNLRSSLPAMTEVQYPPNLPPSLSENRPPFPVRLPSISAQPQLKHERPYHTPELRQLPPIQTSPSYHSQRFGTTYSPQSPAPRSAYQQSPTHHAAFQHPPQGHPLSASHAHHPTVKHEYAPSGSQYPSLVSPHSAYDQQYARRDSVARFEEERRPPYPVAQHISPTEYGSRPQYASAQSSPALPSHYRSGHAPFRGSISSHPGSSLSAGHIHSPSTAAPRSTTLSTHRSTKPVFHENMCNFTLKVRQQPVAARACGFGERDRRVIDPPPIVELQVTDKTTGEPVNDEEQCGLYVLHCTLFSADGLTEETSLHQDQRRPTRRLMGQLVASPSMAKDEHDIEGCFFCFPDLSCRTNGSYRLRFVLMRINPARLAIGEIFPVLTEIQTDVFTVYAAKDFPGMQCSSALTRALKLQGCNIQVKKGNDRAMVRKRMPTKEHSDESSDGGRDPERKRMRYLAGEQSHA